MSIFDLHHNVVRDGTPQVRHIGTSATMAADRYAPASEWRRAVAHLATELFGSNVTPNHVIGETLQPIADDYTSPSSSQIAVALQAPIPQKAEAMLTTCIESAVGLERYPEGAYPSTGQISPRDLPGVERKEINRYGGYRTNA